MKISKVYKATVFYFLLGILVAACASSDPNVIATKPDAIEVVFGNDSSGVFRGHQVGDSVEEVRNKETGMPMVDTDSLLQYHYTYYLESDTTEIDLFYTIDSYGLFEIQVDMHPKTSDGALVLMEKIPEILDSKYGDSKRVGSVKRWTTNSPSNNLIEITLSNETEDAGEPFVSLNFLEPLPDEL